MSRALFRDRRVMWMPFALSTAAAGGSARPRCCEAMAAALTHECSQHADAFACPDALMVYNEPFDEYGLPVHDGGASYVLVARCPWCGAHLPDSCRDRWFDEVERRGLDPDGDDLPPDFLTDAWRRTPSATESA